MYAGAIAGMYLFGIYGGILFISYLIGWSDSTWSERISCGIIILALGLGFGACLNAKYEALERQPVISSCFMIGGKYLMVDSTLRCKNGEDPRYTVLKAERKIEPNEQTRCENCGQIMIHHYDVSCVKTDEELEAERMIDYMNAPL